MPRAIILLIILLIVIAGAVVFLSSQASEVQTETIEVEVNGSANAG